jgi:8-oxo-dGTP pyrophosphatase MutT (NUDIX family)
MTDFFFSSNHPIPLVHNIPRHFTASAVVIANNHILLVHHRRIGSWLPPGGHIEPDELPHQCAERETFEETGVAVSVMTSALPDTGNSDAFILPSPLCMHCVKAVEKGEALYHMDMAYLCRPQLTSGQLPAVTVAPEVKSARWFDLDHLGDISLANNVVEILELAKRRLFQQLG